MIFQALIFLIFVHFYSFGVIICILSGLFVVLGVSSLSHPGSSAVSPPPPCSGSRTSGSASILPVPGRSSPPAPSGSSSYSPPAPGSGFRTSGSASVLPAPGRASPPATSWSASYSQPAPGSGSRTSGSASGLPAPGRASPPATAGSASYSPPAPGSGSRTSGSASVSPAPGWASFVVINLNTTLCSGIDTISYSLQLAKKKLQVAKKRVASITYLITSLLLKKELRFF